MDSTEGLLNQAQDEINELADTNADSVNSEVRYMAYGSQLQTALRTTHRYLAYVRFQPSL
jgi:fission process protein 1